LTLGTLGGGLTLRHKNEHFVILTFKQERWNLETQGQQQGTHFYFAQKALLQTVQQS
jgi:hypothetical protein